MADETASLQLRWEGPNGPPDEFGYFEWTCHYELRIPLQAGDIRRENADGEDAFDAKVVEICSTKRTSISTPCKTEVGEYYFDAPFRDGAHALWDSKLLGNLPIVVIATNGAVIPKPENWERLP